MYVSGKVFAYFINIVFCWWEKDEDKKKVKVKRLKVNVW